MSNDVSRWNNKNCGFQKGHKVFRTKESYREASIKISSALKGRHDIGMFGKKHSEATKKKIGLANSISKKGKPSWNKGKKIPKLIGNTNGFSKGSIPWNKGKKWPEMTGENHPRWKGTTPKLKMIRNGIEFRLWREVVFARDNWTCQKYGIKGGKLHPHHIQNFAQFPELRFAIDNGITLSDKAHREFHKKYGIKNNTREQLEEFLKRKI